MISGLHGLPRVLAHAGEPGETIGSVSNLYWGLAIVFGGATIAAILWIVYKGRDRDQASRKRWKWLPTLLGLGLMGGSLVFAVGASMVAMPDVQQVPASEVADADRVVKVNVTGARWVWQFEHSGITETDVLHLPANSVVVFNLTSTDVIHSFYLPAYGVKKDAIPGETTHLWIQTGEPGEHVAECAQFCGTAHSQMLASVDVMPYEDWNAKIEEQRAQASSGKPAKIDVAVTARLTEWAVDYSQTSVPANVTVGIHVVNEGEMQHNLTIEAPYRNTTPMLEPGEDAWITFTPEEPGRVETWCAIPGHRSQGMEAPLNVTSLDDNRTSGGDT